ncbi:MAG: hypothetical protein U1G07_23870 [Verrucomicrobiota bacterium]
MFLARLRKIPVAPAVDPAFAALVVYHAQDLILPVRVAILPKVYPINGMNCFSFTYRLCLDGLPLGR